MRRLASDTLIYGLGSVANQAVAFLLLPLYTRYLTPADYGTLALIGAAGNVLAMAAALGIHSGLTRIFFTYAEVEDRQAVVATALLFGVASCVLVMAPLWVFADAIAPLLLEGPDRVFLTRLAVVTYGLSALSSIALGILQIHQRARAFVICSLAGLLTSMGLNVYFVAVAGRGVAGVLEGQLLGITMQLGLALFASLPVLRPRFRREPLRRMLAFCLPLLPTNASAWILGLADRYALKEFGSFADVGLYALGYRFGSVYETLFMSPFSLAWSPYLFSILDDANHREICARVLEYYVVIGGTLILLLGLFGEDVIRLIADPSFFGAGQVIFWVGLGFLLRGSTFITVAGIHVRQKTHLSAYAFGFGVLLNLLLLYVLVPRFGMMGAAFAVLITYGTVSFLLYTIAQRVYPIPYRLGRVGLLVSFLAALFAVGHALQPDSLWLRLPWKLAVLAAFPLALVFGGFFTREEITRGLALVRGLVGRAES